MRNRNLPGPPVRIALAGNPNTGKSTLFNALTGLHQHTGNWPGKTVARAEGFFRYHGRNYLVVDLPGTYSLLTDSPEEEVARDFIYSMPDVTVVVADATSLERNLNLVLQVLLITRRVVVCANLVDEATRTGLAIDTAKLAAQLGVPAVATVARNGQGLSELKEAIRQVALLPGDETRRPPAQGFPAYQGELPTSQEERDKLAVLLYRQAEEIAARAVRQTAPAGHTGKRDWNARLDDLLTSRWLGFPIMLLLLALVFWVTLVGANYPSRVLADILFWGEEELAHLFALAGAPPWLNGMVVAGMYRTAAWVVSVMLPPMAIFFPCFALLEDAGYLPRVAFNVDRVFRKMGAHGKQALTMSMGFGCNSAGVVSCRIIESPRERLIAMLTNSFIPCNGRFPTLVALSAMFMAQSASAGMRSLQAAGVVTSLVLAGIAASLAASWVLSRTLLRGVPSYFTLELPPYRRPQLGKVLVRSFYDRTAFCLKRAVSVAAPAGAFTWILANLTLGGTPGGMSIMDRLVSGLHPLGTFLGLDGHILTAFILGLPANEIVLPIALMSYLAASTLVEAESLAGLQALLLSHGWTPVTALCVMLFSVLHYPCATTILTFWKESGSVRWTLLCVLIPTLTAAIVCSLVNIVF